jgi:hypothetical protein
VIPSIPPNPEYAKATGTIEIVPIVNIAIMLTLKIIVIFIVT